MAHTRHLHHKILLTLASESGPYLVAAWVIQCITILPNVREIDGRLWAESDGPGKGARIRRAFRSSWPGGRRHIARGPRARRDFRDGIPRHAHTAG